MKKCFATVLTVVLLCSSIASLSCAKKPAEFTFSDLVLSPAEAEVWQEVTATAKVKNIGQLEGICTAVLKINGAELQSKNISLIGGAIETVTFTFKRDVGPSCDVEINGLTRTLVVKEGILPVLSIGDKWVVKWTVDDFEYNVTMEVTGEDVTNGKNCYAMQVTFEPAFQGIVSSAIAKYEKATMQEVKTQMSGKINDMSFVAVTAFSHEISGSTLYPTAVGAEYRMITTENTITNAAGQTQTQTNKRTTIDKVEKIEDITVPAGTFRCFKIVRYDEQGSVLSTSWSSDKTKMNIKTVESGTGGINVELLSYGIH
ncbi:MAG: hypothetical protein PHY28_00280 [Dehalococcoidales bacterium]|nr:hypothetical protein [Dehalococcoidales bacterium]